MKGDYQPDELLALSGIQHFCFCRRQWALIHVERQWEENALTAQGKILHGRVDDPFFNEIREGVVITHAVPVASYRLGLYGVCDVVEFHPAEDGFCLPGRKGKFAPLAVEYKRGRAKKNHADEVQLCAQTMCLEEMLSVSIPRGYFYYGEIRRRVELEISAELRSLVVNMAAEMHAYFEHGYTPRVKTSKACFSCSMENVCLPVLQGDVISASQYVQMQVDGE